MTSIFQSTFERKAPFQRTIREHKSVDTDSDIFQYSYIMPYASQRYSADAMISNCVALGDGAFDGFSTILNGQAPGRESQFRVSDSVIFVTFPIRFILVAILGLNLAALGNGQIPDRPVVETLNGKVKSVTHQRTYFIKRGQRISPEIEVTSTTTLDTDGKVIQYSIFGNGEERTTYKWSGDTAIASVAFYDLNGRLSVELSKSFRPLTDEIPEEGLCSEYKTLLEKEQSTKIEREVETCSDRSVRRTTIYEFASNGDLLRMNVEDAKGRSWIYENTFGLNFKITGFKYTVNNLTRPRYSQEVTITSEQFDQNNNRISYMVSSTNSLYPGQIRYQYLDESKIVYFK